MNEATVSGAVEEQLPPALILALLLGLPVLVIGLSNWPLVTLAGLALLTGFTLRGRRERFWSRLALQAALWGTIGEAVCVMGNWNAAGTGLWIYHFPQPFGLSFELPIWLPLVWTDLMILFAALGRRLAPASGRSPEALRYLLMLGLIAYAAAIMRTVDPRILYVFVPFFAAFILYWNTPRDLWIFAAAAFFGSFGELMCMRAGLWTYTLPAFRAEWLVRLGWEGVPISLPMAWGLSAVFLNRLAGRGEKDDE